MQLIDERTVRDLASTNPAAARIFEMFGIDYCCGGEKSLAQACSAANVNVGEVVAALKEPGPAETDRDWQTETLAALAKYIVEKHHGYIRREIPRLVALLAKVVQVHGLNHAELRNIELSFQALSGELSNHLLKEERMLFPYIEQLEIAAKNACRPTPSIFGTVRNPVRMMVMEHDMAGELLHNIRGLTNGYHIPEDACMSFQTLYRGLSEFEVDLHQHIHLENNILFPRAIALEEHVL